MDVNGQDRNRNNISSHIAPCKGGVGLLKIVVEVRENICKFPIVSVHYEIEVVTGMKVEIFGHIRKRTHGSSSKHDHSIVRR